MGKGSTILQRRKSTGRKNLTSFRVSCAESRILVLVLLPQVFVDFLVADIKRVDIGGVSGLPWQLDLGASSKGLDIKTFFTVWEDQCVCVCVCVHESGIKDK